MKLKELYLSLIKESKIFQVNELDIRYLITYFFKLKNQSSFFLSLDEDVKVTKKFQNAFKKLCSGVPISYIINECEFLGEKYYVDKRVLIPRVETEELVSLAIKEINRYFKNKRIKILDIGTGSGVIAINLKKAFKEAEVSATDISLDALKVAKINIKNLDIKLFHNDTFPNNKDIYDVIISNPPYIKDEKTIDESVLKYEPKNALMLNDENVYKKVFSSKRFNHPSLLIFEIAPDIVDYLKKLLVEHLTDAMYIFKKDINNKVRFLIVYIR